MHWENTKEFPCRDLKKKIPFRNKIHTGRTLQCLVWNASRTPLLSVSTYDNSQTQHRAFPLGVSAASIRKNTSLWSAWTRCRGFASWRWSLVKWRQTRSLAPPCGSPASRCAEAPAPSRICWWPHTATAWTRTRSWCSSTSSSLISQERERIRAQRSCRWNKRQQITHNLDLPGAVEKA